MKDMIVKNYPIRYEIMYFAIDLINKRNLSNEDFFKYINCKYDDIRSLRRHISYCKEMVSKELGTQMEIVLNYKLASMNNNKEMLEKYKTQFCSLKNIKLNSNEKTKKAPIITEFNKSEYYKRAKEKPELINNALDNYINGASKEEIMEILGISSNLANYFKQNLNYISDYEKYIKFYINNYKLDVISENDINELIEIIEFFIKNIQYNYELLNTYKQNTEKYRKEIMQIHIGDENLNPYLLKNIGRVLKYKIVKINSLYKSYSSILEYLKQFKEFLKDGNKLPEPLLQNKILNIDEQFIKEAYLSSSKIIRYYQLLSTITKLDDDGISLVKNLYLKNITKN